MVDILHDKVVVKDIPMPGHPITNITDLAKTISSFDGRKATTNINYLPFSTSLDEVQFSGSIILLHELFHSVDHVARYRNQSIIFNLIDTRNPLYRENESLYHEARTVMIENQFRIQSGQSSLGIRKMYGGVDLQRWYDFKSNVWYTR